MNIDLDDEYIENITFDELTVGQTARLVRTLSLQDIQAFAAVSGDTNPAHLDPKFADSYMYHQLIGHGMWSGSLISTLLGTILPGPGTIYHDQSLHFKKPVRLGDTLTVIVSVKAKDELRKLVTFDCHIKNQQDELVVSGEAKVIAPVNKIRQPKIQLPQIHLFDPTRRIKEFIDLARGLEPIRCGVVHPCDKESIGGLLIAAEKNLIYPVLIGSLNKIKQIAEEAQIDISQFELVDTPHSHAAAEIAAKMAEEGKLEALMKGSLHTDELMHAILQSKSLRTKRRVSHIFRFEVPLYDKPILISDAALNIKPTLLEKRDIVQNAIDLSHILGCENPKVALLSAVETVNPDIPSTIEAAALCKMADRGQITGGILDGPLAFDNAVSLEAKRIKHITSPVAGQADILIVPDLESGNMLSKQLEYLAGAISSGVVLGCKIPIALTSRADGPTTRMASAVLAKLVAHHYRLNKP